jgi:hypothetical protein
MDYLGIGGPEIILDIVMGPDGMPTKIEPIFEAPPGMTIEVPEEHHNLGE